MQRIGESLNRILILVEKDLRLEFRTKDNLSIMTIFGLSVIFIFSYFKPEKSFLPILIYIVLLFSSFLFIYKTFLVEKERRTIYSIILSLISEQELLISKILSNYIISLITLNVFFIMFIIFFGIEKNLSSLYLGLNVIIISLTIMLTFLSLFVLFTRQKETLFIIISIPIIFPISIVSISMLDKILNGSNIIQEIRVILSISIFFLFLSLLLVDKVLEEIY